MRVLILTNYFTPDLSAGSFRMQALVDALSRYRDQGLEVDVITTRPNRYASMKVEAPLQQDEGWLRIHRIELPEHKNGMLDQAFAYTVYARGIGRLTRSKRWDLILATSSRLMTAVFAAYFSRRTTTPLYLDIRDLFTDNMSELLAGKPTKALMPLFRLAERYALRSASRINIVSAGFQPHVLDLSPHAEIRTFTNGVDDIFLREDFFDRPVDCELPLILYAGNIGEGQGLHKVVPRAAQLLAGYARFRLIGDGGKRKALEEALESAQVNNVELLSPVPRSRLMQHYREADILFLHLNDLESFRKVLPSKIFEYAATGKPLLAGVGGYAAEFLRGEVAGAEVFAPCDPNAMAEGFQRLLNIVERPDRSAFLQKYSRTSIMKEMAWDLLSVVQTVALRRTEECGRRVLV